MLDQRFLHKSFVRRHCTETDLFVQLI